MKKNPILVFTGLAIAAVAAVAGLTRDQWLTPAPQTIAGSETAKTPETVAPAEIAAPVEAPAQPVVEAPPPASETKLAAAAPPPAQPPKTAAAPPTQQESAPPQVAAAAPVAETSPPVAEANPKVEVPAFDTVRIEKSGEAVIAGTAEAGSEVIIKLDGAEIGKTTANSEGAFVVIPNAPLPAGSGALTIEAKSKGNPEATASKQSVAVIVPVEDELEPLVAVISPNAATKVLQKPALKPETEPTTEPVAQMAAVEPVAPVVAKPVPEQPAASTVTAAAAKPVSIDVVDYDNTGNIVFSGQGEPGHTARVYVDNSHTGDAAIGTEGRWTFAGTAKVAKGVHSLRVDSLDSSGKVLNRVEVPFFREEQTKVAAAVPADQTVAKTVTEINTEPKNQLQPVVPAANSEPPQETAAATPPAQAEQLVISPDKPRDGRVVIQPGNNLWRISQVLYGSGMKYTLLYQANKNQIRNPDMIFPGQIFMTPDVAANRETVDPKRRDPLTPEEGAGNAQ
jgi:nucleoid-associated protein YgaU